MKHTPAPWRWDEPANWLGVHARIYHEKDGTYEPIAQVQLVGWPKEVGRANARLIAAAPELLHACKGMEAWFSCQILLGKLRANVELDRIRAAIAIAEARS